VAAGADVSEPANKRFAAERGDDIPSFQRHVLPLMGRLGCNGRACHGSFQGQGGFRLSLFGYDFKSDHDALTAGNDPRVHRTKPELSLAIEKPLNRIAHKGGKRFEAGSWEHHLLLRWARAGAPGANDDDPDFTALHVEPREFVAAKPGEKFQLKVIAQWADGKREDVTPLARFRSNDEAIAAVDENGFVTVVGKGGTDVVAFYDNGVVPVQVILPVSDRVGANYPSVPTPTKIDELVVARLRKLGIVPSEPCTDVEFLRRVSLDLTGTLPLPEEVTKFLADAAPDKRAKKIEELLARPTYSAYWGNRLCDWTGNAEATGILGGERGLNGEKSRLWAEWLERRVAENTPYDKLVEGIVLAVSRKPGQSYEEYCEEMVSYFRSHEPADFAANRTMPFFWTRKTLGSPSGKALAFAYSFLGVSLQCAQCHKHPYDQWTKQDFDQFAAFFNGVSIRTGNRAEVDAMKKAVGLVGDEDSGAFGRMFVKLAEAGKKIPFRELSVPAKKVVKAGARPAKTAGRVITPRLLGGEEVVASGYDDPRQPLMDWMRQEDNPYFARAFVNRVWASYFNVGIIDPTDDLNLANPPSNPALLDYLSHGFIESGYDMKWLHRQIVTSRTYQASWRPNETNRLDERNFSHAVLRRLPAEVLYDALVHATANDATLAYLHKNPMISRAIGRGNGYANRGGSNYALNLFGKPPRVINCECERSLEPSLLQTVFLRNDSEMLKMLDRNDSWLKAIVKQKDLTVEDLVRQAYLRTLSRLPDERESAAALKHMNAAPSLLAGTRELMWALINTKEFVINR
jgi:hypothetical protein